ncbi:D-alanine--D-alanyl carrier protein ligase [Seminavis robusta]|uniref:D-alanine--D-alanyl carrier protein ligase n=1 Tax=Seminavis robusta TaxID=568900 RepID=A0A9N8H052_9STRA|nr:D-alanine--D-alanyl carrier protein ligase [Seminavis robusta]|eukprot:Sro14_g010770.1 D-alanine--D-alanyl carrier protein ligase (1578) ;mRNA; f:149965-154766
MKFSATGTILHALNHHASETPDKVVFTWVNIKCEEQNKVTFKQLQDQSNAVAARLLKLGCHKGDRVMIAYPFGLEFLAGMFGAMKAGVIPCSIYPPNPNQLKTDMPKFRGFVEDAGAKYALTTAAFAAGMTAASVLYKTGVKWIGTDKLPIKKHNPNKPKDYETFEGEPNNVCFIQYTSGSTGRPKGVMISHRSLAENCMALVKMTDVSSSSMAALWVPQYHDMGLVAGFMSCLYGGFHLVLASPLDFVARPLLWTDMIEQYQATHTCAPTFAYALLLKRLEQANRTANWSCVKRAMFGGEPAQSHVVEGAAKALSIKPAHVYNIYGLAESVVFLTGGSAYPDSEGLVCCGEVDSPTLKLRIVQDGKEVKDGQVGSIWAQSPRVAAGYYGQSELTTATFANVLPGYAGSWLDTGDLGKVVDGQLYVTGRVKDVIIINGKNYYPTDVELSIDDLFGDVIRPGRTTAFQYGEDSVGITVEGRKDFDKPGNKHLAVQISNHVSQVHGLLVSNVVVLKLGVTPKTTSGKLKRSEIRLTTIAGDWKDPSVLLRFQRQANRSPIQANISSAEKSSFLEHSFAMNGVTSTEFYLSDETQHKIRRRSMTLPFESLDFGSVPNVELPDIEVSQTDALPAKAVEAVHAVECNPSKLDEYFSELHLSGVSGIDDAWSNAIKTTAAMQSMCSQILCHLEDKHPSICQLACSLVENPDWILLDDRTDFLSQLVHQIFVLQWATIFMMDNPVCMEQKLQKDAEWERMLGYTPPSQTRNNGMVLNEEYWLSKLDQWERMNNATQKINPTSNVVSAVGGGAAIPNDFSTKYITTIRSILGLEADTSKTWAENGLSSLKSAELRNKMEEEFHATLPANFEQLYPTPNALSVFLEASKGQSFPKDDVGHLEFEWNSSRSKCSKPVLGILQGLASIVIFLLLLVSLLPTYFLGSWVFDIDRCDSATGSKCHGPAFWILLPMAFPMFILSFSLVVVFSKNAVVGTYQPRQFEILSWAYLRWWFMDRLMDIWESIVGHFFLETRYIWLFYWLLGADLAWSAKIEAYIREFDLVKVGSNATIGHSLKCRKFAQSNEECPKITFRPIVIGNNCKISGMVSPGSIVGDGSKVEKLTVVEAGSKLPNDVLAKGIPAYSSGIHHYSEPIQKEETALGVIKIVWTLIESYHFFTLSFLVHALLNQILPLWRYATILHWILLVPTSSFLALLTSMALKWLLIGKRDPSDDYDGSLYRRATNWACDFHFRVACWTLTPFFGQSRLWNIVLFLHGLDVDMESGLNNPYLIFYPSKVDFVKIRNSFIATISLDFGKKGDSKIEIINSSVGYNVTLHAGVKIMRSAIPPRSDVPDSVYDLNQSGDAWKPTVIMDLFLPEVVQMLLNLGIFASLIPAYEIGLAATRSSSISITTCGITAAFVLQLFLWILSSRAVERALMILPKYAQQSFFGVYINHVWIFGVGNWLVLLLYGTPMFAYYARMMGATVEGELWYFGNALYEYEHLHFKGITVVDSAHVSGHYIDLNGLTIDDTYVSGVLHPGCYASAGSVVSAAEHGPWKVFLKSGMGAKDSTNLPSDSASNNVDSSNLV